MTELWSIKGKFWKIRVYDFNGTEMRGMREMGEYPDEKIAREVALMLMIENEHLQKAEIIGYTVNIVDDKRPRKVFRRDRHGELKWQD